jgi:hypothetical protein
MFEIGKHRGRAAETLQRWTRGWPRRLGLAAVVACGSTSYVAAADAPVEATASIKIAVFAFELEDFTAAAAEGSSPNVTGSLAQATEEAKRQLQQSGRYSLVDTDDADITAAKGQGLRHCGGCEAAIAMKLGADQALIGVVTKISMTEYVVQMQVSDARKGAVISRFTTGLRMGAHESWSRGVRWLMKNRMLASK